MLVIIFRKLRIKKVQEGKYQAWFDFENSEFLLTVTGANTPNYRMKFDLAYTDKENVKAELQRLKEHQHCIFDSLVPVITMCAMSGESTINKLKIVFDNECKH